MTENMKMKLTQTIDMPKVGFGTYLISNDETSAAVSTAIRAGYRHVDTAQAYKNETGVGAGIQAGLKSEGLSRDQIFVTTKLWPGSPAWGEVANTYDSSIESLDASLARLQLDYVDLYLIHAPFGKDNRLE